MQPTIKEVLQGVPQAARTLGSLLKNSKNKTESCIKKKKK
jgi:hypothetical protein